MFNPRTTVAHWLWTHNPFYVISSLLMLYGVRASYGEIDIGTINCWRMMAILGGYTLVLAGVGVLIVRWGRVWDDARSILLLLLLLFLAVSVSADDLFVKMESIQGGAALMICGFSFSVAILLGVLYATRIHLKLVYLVPLILFLALFFIAPWWCSPELHPKNAMTLDWTLFLFPQVAAIILLTLIPAVRLGQKSVEGNGTPWSWPLFPWSAFVFIGVAVVLRSYALTMTFSQTGLIWTSPDYRLGIAFDTIWRPYFLVPFALAVLILIVEAGLVVGNRHLIRRAIWTAPALLPMAWPWASSGVLSDFVTSLTGTLGSPVWLTVWLLIAFYGWATVRRAEKAEVGLLASVLILSIIGPKTISIDSLTAISSIPLFLVGMTLGFVGVARRSSALALVAASLITAGAWVELPATQMAAYRMATCYHAILATCILLSIVWRDPLAKRLQVVGSILLFASAAMVLSGQSTAEVPWEWRFVYVAGLAGTGFFCARVSHSLAYWTGFLGTIGVMGYAIAVDGYRNASAVLGRNSMTAFSWSAGTLLIGVLISARKARWIPPLARNALFGNTVLGADDAQAANAISAESDRGG